MEAAIGIIGLSLQLVDSAIKVKRVIGTYRSASREIGRLAQNIEKVEAVAGAIKKCFEGDASNRRCSELIHTWGIVVLRDIQSTLGEIQDIIDKLEKRASKSRTLYTVGFSFLEKKDEIARLSSALDRNLNDLQHMMTAEIFSRFSVTEQLTSTPTNTQVTPSKPELPRNPEAISTTVALNWNGTTTAIERSDSKPVQILGFQGGMQSTRVTKKMRRHGLNEFVNVKESKSYTFGIRGYSYRVELGWTFDTLTPISYSLNLQHIVKSGVDRELFVKTDTVIRAGDLRGLQRMFTNREISPTTFLESMTLFEFAIIWSQPRICHFLAGLNLRQCLAEDISRPEGGHLITGGFYGRASDLIDMDNVFLLTGASPTLRMQWLLGFRLKEELFFPHYHRIRASELGVIEREEFLNVSWSTVVYMFIWKVEKYWWLPYFRSPDEWINIFTALAKEGIDARQICSWTDHPQISAPIRESAFTMILLSSACHRRIEGVISHWLTVLQAAGIDVEAYLSWERLCCEEVWANSGRLHKISEGKWPQVLGSKTIGGFEVPMWYRWVDPSQPAYEARHEFRNWGSLVDGRSADGNWVKKYIVGNTSQHLLWKICPNSRAYEDDWPFVPLMSRDLSDMEMRRSCLNLTDEDLTDLSQSLNYAKDLVAKRFNRRQMKKLYKSGYLRKEKHALKIPGAWTDSEW